MTRYLVTGGSGFIGSALVRTLIGRTDAVLNFDKQTYASAPSALKAIEGHPGYSLVEADIADHDAMSEAFVGFEPDVVINLAAETHVDRSIDDAWPFVNTNVVGVATLLHVATDYWTRTGRTGQFRFVQVSTDEVFGSVTSGVFQADSPYNPMSPYSASKAAGDHLARAWFHTYGLPVIVTNSSNNYGPYQHPEKLIPLLTVRAMESMSLPIYGDGLHERDWIHVDDHVNGLIAASEVGRPGATYLFGSGTSRTNLSVAHQICQLVDSHLDRPPGTAARLLEFVTDRPGHDRRYCIDPGIAERELGWSHRPFDTGLAATVEWYCNNRDWWLPLVTGDATARRGLGR